MIGINSTSLGVGISGGGGSGSSIYKGQIAVNTDFPLIAEIVTGWWYQVTANVTDNAGVLYTNTGLSFVEGDEIYWDGTTWQPYGRILTSYFDATIGGATADYPATSITNGIEQAIIDGKTRFKLLTNISLFGNTVLPTFALIDFNGFSITIGAFTFVPNSKSKLLSANIIGNWTLINSNLILENDLKLTGNLIVNGNNCYIRGVVSGTTTDNGTNNQLDII